MSTGLALFLIAAGAILRFAVTDGSLRGLNLHTVGVIVLLLGIAGLLLPMAAPHAPRRREDDPSIYGGIHGSSEIRRADAAT